jgi:hypothetical protein
VSPSLILLSLREYCTSLWRDAICITVSTVRITVSTVCITVSTVRITVSTARITVSTVRITESVRIEVPGLMLWFMCYLLYKKPLDIFLSVFRNTSLIPSSTSFFPFFVNKMAAAGPVASAYVPPHLYSLPTTPSVPYNPPTTPYTHPHLNPPWTRLTLAFVKEGAEVRDAELRREWKPPTHPFTLPKTSSHLRRMQQTFSSRYRQSFTIAVSYLEGAPKLQVASTNIFYLWHLLSS